MMPNKNEDKETTGKLEVNTPQDRAVQKFLQEIEVTVSKVFSEGGKINGNNCNVLWDYCFNVLLEQ
jgi:hypothetical protein